LRLFLINFPADHTPHDQSVLSSSSSSSPSSSSSSPSSRMNQENHGAPQWRSKSPCAARSCPGSWWPALAAPRVGFCDVLRDSEEPLITRVGVAGPRWVAKTVWSCAREVSSAADHEEVTAASSLYDIAFFCLFRWFFISLLTRSCVSWGRLGEDRWGRVCSRHRVSPFYVARAVGGIAH